MHTAPEACSKYAPGAYLNPGGVPTYLAERGCAALSGSLFYKKSLNMGPVFYPKIL